MQLLNEWTTHTTAAELISISGTVYNAPGAFDGDSDHHTSCVVDCNGRKVKTVEGAQFYLGYCKGSTPEQREQLKAGELAKDERSALGLNEEELAV